MGKLMLCTGNKHKVSEISAVLGSAVRVITPLDLGVAFEVVEDQDSFEGNARKKALEGVRLSGLPSLADDSGLCVDALDGNPGVRSARFAADHGQGSGDSANNALLLGKLAGMAPENRSAHFVCVLALANLAGEVRFFRGELCGHIGSAPQGTHGFGYDPLMVLPDGRSVAQLSEDEKNLISHRARALALARDAILALVD